MLVTLNWSSANKTVDEHLATLLSVDVRQTEPDSGDVRRARRRRRLVEAEVLVDWVALTPEKGCDGLELQLLFLDAEGRLLDAGEYRVSKDGGYGGGSRVEVEDVSTWRPLRPQQRVAALEAWITTIHREEVGIEEAWWGLAGAKVPGRYEAHVAVQVTSPESVPEVELSIRWLDGEGQQVVVKRTSSLSPGLQVIHVSWHCRGPKKLDRRPEIRLSALHRRSTRVDGSLD
ncbi:MAG TPA: hypothetical protein QGF58_16655 [Myxococcota bacterium]|nr:hypothetical protein [Myxococcota bacterium]